MRTILMVAMLTLGAALPATADSEALRVCRTDQSGTRTCTTITVKVQTDRIMNMPASAYERGVKSGKCMPSPSGACGGG